MMTALERKLLLKEDGNRPPSSYGGMGWNATHGYLGTGAVVMPKAQDVAQDWAKTLKGRLPLPAQKSEWDEFAKRNSLSPEDTEKGWNILTKNRAPVASVEEVVRAMKEVLGESTSWWGYSVPNISMLHMPQQPAPGFGFRTGAAEKIWLKTIEMAKANPNLSPAELIGQALETDDQVSPLELTQEDYRLLEMGLHWIKSGMGDWQVPAGIPPKIGGAPGGPFRSNTDGHTLRGKASP
jgi:hypothetical protein